MRKATILFVVAIPIVIGIGCTNPPETKKEEAKNDTMTAAATTETLQPAPPPMDSATTMKKMQEYMTPGEMHKLLASCNGKWTMEITSWAKPGASPIKSEATVENQMLMGGRYHQSLQKGIMNGKPFEGMSIVGYNNETKMFQDSWVNNMGTGIKYLEGPYDATTKTIMLRGTIQDPIFGKTEVRETFQFIDDKTNLLEMYLKPQGMAEFKKMEVKMVRK